MNNIRLLGEPLRIILPELPAARIVTHVVGKDVECRGSEGDKVMKASLPYAECRCVFQSPDGLAGAGFHPFDDLRKRVTGTAFANQDAVKVVGITTFIRRL